MNDFLKNIQKVIPYSQVTHQWVYPYSKNYLNSQVLNLSEKELRRLDAEIETIRSRNKEIAKSNRSEWNKIREDFGSIMEKYKVVFPLNYNPTLSEQRSRNRKINSMLSNLKKTVTTHVIEPPLWYGIYSPTGKRIYVGESYSIFETVKKAKNELQLQYNLNQEIIKSTEYLIKRNIFFTETDDVVAMANDHAEREFIKSNYPEGKSIEISCCDQCNTWVVGEKRCSCGNCRINLNVKRGNDGFIAYAVGV